MADICIIGAGPAGSTFAARMAQLGHDVCLIERARFPRSHLGESLSPGVMPLLETTGARDAIDAAGFRRVRSVQVKWDDGLQVREDPREEGLLVERGRFDSLLLERAKALGVRVLQPAVVREHRREDDGWCVRIEAEGRVSELRADFLADASGRSAGRFAARRRTGCRTLALYAYWRGSTLPEQPRIEAGTEAWYWGVPLPDGTYNTLVFVDVGHFRAATRHCEEQRDEAIHKEEERLRRETWVSLCSSTGQGGCRMAATSPLLAPRDDGVESLTTRFLDLIARSGLMESCRDARIIGSVLAIDATPYLDEDSVSPFAIKVGEAALAIDPLSSSGVQKAIQSALASAVVANTLLRRPESSDAALRFYQQNLVDASDRHCRWAAAHYGTVAMKSGGKFWQDRASRMDVGAPVANRPSPPGRRDGDEGRRGESRLATARVALSHELEFVDLPCLEGDFVTVKPALRHPSLEDPVAYLGGWELAPLLRCLPVGLTPVQIAQSWSARIPLKSGLAIAGWLLNNGILVGQTAGERVASTHREERCDMAIPGIPEIVSSRRSSQ